MAKCPRCGKQTCESDGFRCLKHLKGACKKCHGEEHDKEFPELWWNRLDYSLGKMVEEDKFHQKRFRGTMKGMLEWFKRYDNEDAEKLWKILEELANPREVGWPFVEIYRAMKNWKDEFDADNHDRLWEVLDGHYKNSSSKNPPGKELGLMVNFQREFYPDDREKMWRVLILRLWSRWDTPRGSKDHYGALVDMRDFVWGPLGEASHAEEYWALLRESLGREGISAKERSKIHVLSVTWLREYDEINYRRIIAELEDLIGSDSEQGNMKGVAISNSNIWEIVKENHPDDLDWQWTILERTLEAEYAQDNQRGQSMVLQHMITNLLKRDSYDVEKAWGLVEEKLAVDKKQGNLIGMITSLDKMVELHEEHGEWDPGFLWRLLERRLDLEITGVDEGLTFQGKALSTIIKMEFWIMRNGEEGGPDHWHLIQRRIDLDYEDDTESRGKTLRRVARHWAKFGNEKARIAAFSGVMEILDSGVGPLEAFECYLTLQIIGEEFPERFMPNGENEGLMDQLAVKWFSLCARGDMVSMEAITEIREGGSYILVHDVEGPWNIRMVSVSREVPNFEIEEKEGRVVLDLPNITGDILRWKIEGEGRGEEHYNTTMEGQEKIMDAILKEAKSRFDEVWFACTPNLIRKFGHGIEFLLRDSSVGLLLNNIDSSTTNEDEAFISYAMATGSRIVSGDGFYEECQKWPRMGSFLKEKSIGFQWYRGDFHIERPLQFVTSKEGGLTKDEAGITNLVMKIVYDHYGWLIYSVVIKSVSISEEEGHLGVLIRPNDHQKDVGTLIGRRGKKIGELKWALERKLGLSVKVTIPRNDANSQ